MKAWKAALAASVAAAAIALIVVAPMAQSSRSPGGLKVVSVTALGGSNPNTVTAKCPRGFVAIAGGFDAQQVNVLRSEKRDKRRWTVRANHLFPRSAANSCMHRRSARKAPVDSTSGTRACADLSPA